MFGATVAPCRPRLAIGRVVHTCTLCPVVWPVSVRHAYTFPTRSRQRTSCVTVVRRYSCRSGEVPSTRDASRASVASRLHALGKRPKPPQLAISRSRGAWRLARGASGKIRVFGAFSRVRGKCPGDALPTNEASTAPEKSIRVKSSRERRREVLQSAPDAFLQPRGAGIRVANY